MTPAAGELTARRVTVTGIVQGVGFRPFVYALARTHHLGGWVRNTPFGVEIVLVGGDDDLARFLDAFPTSAPPLAVLDQIDVEPVDLPGTPAPGLVGGERSPLFLIHPSAAPSGDFVPVSPDVALCPDCRHELLDPADRRYRYPFINCTNCGPRFTIVVDLPYDRPATTMAGFVMCPACRAEYENPTDRRFHAQPIACPVCGPRLTFATGADDSQPLHGEDALRSAQRLLAAGGILAVKGLGGYHLACDATRGDAVATLRRRKGRRGKPLAVMARDLAVAATVGVVDAGAAHLLEDKSHPILLLDKRPDSPVAPEVAPGSPTVGVMLPYTPLHVLLLAPNPTAPDIAVPPLLVMTSGNLSEEPIAYTDDEAFARLGPLVDGFLLHDRPIHIHCDDSVIRRSGDQPVPIRRARGLAPLPLRLPFDLTEILAVGAELKNTFCLTRGRYAFLSQHIGDMENLATQAAFERVLTHFETIFRCHPLVLACDLHPGYLATRWAEAAAAARGLPLVRVQHHHAHLAALLAEHSLPLDTQAIGVILDGTGYGTDGTIWGGEFLVGGYANARRVGRLRPVPLPGGDAAIRRPYRTALAHLWAAGIPPADGLPPVATAGPTEVRVLARQFQTGFNTVPTSSMGRLFDAAAALAGVRQVVDYEAQAAIEWEDLARRGMSTAAGYPLTFIPSGTADYPLISPDSDLQFELDPRPLIRALAADVRAGAAQADMAVRFHQGVVAALVAACRRLADETGLDLVALSGGVWQNTTLLEAVVHRLTQAGLRVLTHRRVPPNDGGVALGQALVAHAQVSAGGVL